MTWDSSDAVLLREYLKANPKFLVHLATLIPKVETGRGIEVAGLTGAAHAGGEALIESVNLMAGLQPAPEKTPFVG